MVPSSGIALRFLRRLTDGIESKSLDDLRTEIEKEGAAVAIIAAKIKGVKTSTGKLIPADMALSGASSVLFDALVILASEEGVKSILEEPQAEAWVRDGFAHLKFMGYSADALPLLEKIGTAVEKDKGCTKIDSGAAIKLFFE